MLKLTKWTDTVIQGDIFHYSQRYLDVIPVSSGLSATFMENFTRIIITEGLDRNITGDELATRCVCSRVPAAGCTCVTCEC